MHLSCSLSEVACVDGAITTAQVTAEKGSDSTCYSHCLDFDSFAKQPMVPFGCNWIHETELLERAVRVILSSGFFDIEAHVPLIVNALVLSEEKFVATQPNTRFHVFLGRRALLVVNVKMRAA
jgi:hypothetical protein